MKKDLSVSYFPKASMRFISVVTVLMMVVGLVSSTVAFAAEESDSFGPIVRQAVKSDLSPPLRSIKPIPPEAADGGILEIPSFSLPKNAGGGSSSPDLDVQSVSGEMKMPPTIVNFEGVDNRNSVLPPDTEGDVGPNHYVQIVNLSFAIWDKSGTLLYGPANNNTIWSGFGGDCETHNNGDPIVLYDPFADRWLISQFALDFWTDFHECIAISETPDPTGAWHRYDFLYGTSKMNDYPKFGVWPDGYYMTANQFTAGGWAGAGVVAYERDAMLVGDPGAQSVYFDLASVDINYGGMLPSDFDGTTPPPAGSPNYFAEWDDSTWIGPNDSVRIWEFHVDWANPANSTFGIGGNPNYVVDTSNVDPNMCNYVRNCIPQPGGSNVDAISDRLMFRLQYRNFGGYETLVANHTVDVGGDHAGIHWMELRDSGSGWGLHQDGVYAPDADHRWMGSVAMDRDGNIALGYSVSSTQTYPSIRYTGRMAGDPLGTLPQGEASVIAGSGYQTHSSGRWGDYSMMSVDPVDDCTFWYTQEYYAVVGNAPWQTRVGAFQFPTCAGDIPDIYVDPTSFYFEVPLGGSDSAPLTIGNAGGAGLDWGISVVTYGVEPLGSGETDLVALGDTTSDAIEADLDLTTNASYAVAPFKELTPILESAPGGNVLWDLTHGVYLDYQPSGSFSTLVALLSSAGFTVSTTDIGLDNVDLTPFDIVVVNIGSAYFSAYTPSEVAAIEAFVLNGGGLLLMGDNAGTPSGNINPVAQTFGSTCGVSDLMPFDLYITNLAPHPIFDSVGEIFFRAAGEVTVSPPSTLVAFEPSGLGAVAVAEVGPGKVAVLGDINVWDNLYISTSSNQLFAENTFNWLTTPSGPSWLSADPLSGSVPPGDVDLVDVNVDSTGLAVGIYTGELLIYSNDPDENPLSVPVTMEVVPLEPDIEVDPTSVSSTQPPDTVEVKPLDILNVGSADLIWDIFEEEPPAAPQAGTGEWLYRSQEGVILEANNGGQAMAYPSAYRWQPDEPSAPLNILIYADDYIHVSPNTFPDQALQILGLPYTAHYDGDTAGFETSLTTGTWDLVLFSNDSYSVPASVWTALDSYVNGGGMLILHTWYVYPDPTHPLWSTLGFTWVDDDFSPPDPVYWWVPGHPFFTIPESVPEFTSLTDGVFGRYGMYIEPLPGFEALAGYTTPGPDPNLAAMVYGNGDRTVFKAFLDGHNDADLDVDSRKDGVELWINMILGLTEPVCTPGDIPWVSVSPTMGTTPPAGLDTVNVTFDSTGLGAGTYNGNLCITSNDPDESLVVVPVALTVETEPPDIEVDPTSVSSVQPPNQVEVKPLDISNVGGEDLIWEVVEELPAVSIPASGDDFPRGTAAPSFGLPYGAAPSEGSPAGEPLAGLLSPSSSAYATESVYLNFTQLDLDIPEVLNTVAPYTTTYIWAGDFLGADFSKTYAIGENNMLVTLDTATGAETVLGSVPAPPPDSIYTGMAYDPTTDTMFASSCDISVSHLYIVDLITPATTLVGEITNSPCTIAIGVDDAGQMYGHDLVNDVLMSINKATGAGTVIGSLGFDANYGQGMDFDSASGQLYLAAFNNSTYQAELRIADTATGATALVGVLGQTIPGGIVQLGWLANAGVGCISGDIPWVSVSPTMGTTPPGGTDTLDVAFDSTGLPVGSYAGNLCVLSNDPDEPVVFVPLDLEVTQAGEADLWIEPSTDEIPILGETTVDIMVGDVTNLYGIDLELAFDPTIVEVVGAQLTPGSCPAPDFVLFNEANNVAGTIKYAVTSLLPSLPCTPGGMVASITFRGLAEGTSPVAFTSWLLADSDGFAIGVETVTDGEVIVISIGTLEGYVELQGRTDYSGAEVCAWAGGIPVSCETTDASGYYLLNLPQDTYDVAVEMSRYLDGLRTGVFVPAGGLVTLPFVKLLGGDATEDDKVNILDLSLIGGQYGRSEGDPDWDARADINNDLTVNILDVVLAASNFNKVSPVPWP